MSAPRVPPPTTLVLGTELKADDAHVADVAVELASLLGVPLVLVHAVALAEDDDPDRSAPNHVAHERMRERVEERDRVVRERLEVERQRLTSRATGRCPDVSFRLVARRPFEAVCEITNEIAGAWAVVGAHGTHARLGGTADRVVRESHASVLVIPREAQLGTGGVLAAIDAGPLDERVLGVAAMLARRLSTRLGLIHVRDGNDERAMLRVNTHTRDVAPEIASTATLSVMHVEGSIARTIADHADRTATRIIVAGTHGRRGAVRWILGSTAEELGHVSKSPVLIVR